MKPIRIPEQKRPDRVEFNQFKGVDFSTYSGSVATYRSPDALNLIPTSNEQPEKRFGSTLIQQYADKINGLLFLTIGVTTYKLVHHGTSLTLDGTILLSTALADARSTYFQMNSALWIFDGAIYWKFYISGVTPTFEAVVGTIPVTVILRDPNEGGGTTYEDVNLLQKKRKNKFCVVTAKAAATQFTLNFIPDTGTEVKAWYLDVDKITWVQTTNFTVSYSTATITFGFVIGVSPDEGKDNVEIEAERTVTSDGIATSDFIKKCTIQTLFGLSTYNQAFISGNPNRKNYMYYCKANNPAFFSDIDYLIIGQDNTAVMGTRKSGSQLAIIKENNYQDATAFLMSGQLTSETDIYGDLIVKVTYTVQQGVAGVGAISKYAFADLRDDHLFLSEDGVFALTTNAVTAEKYAQQRSSNVAKRITQVGVLNESQGISHNGFYYLACDGKVYIADASQKFYGKGDTFEYEWYYWSTLPVRVWAIDGDDLIYGTVDGKVVKVITVRSEATYYDDANAINAHWVTPSIDMSYGDLYKTIRHIFTKLLPYTHTGVKIYVMIDGSWELIDDKVFSLFSFFDIDFNNLTFHSNAENISLATTVKAKRVITTQFKFENNTGGDGFGLQSIVVHYVLKNRIK